MKFKKTTRLFLFVIGLAAMTNLHAQNVGIGTSIPDASAKLHIVDANRGILIPQISIVDVSGSAPVTLPATGLLVWNNSATTLGGSGTGFYYWNGAQWDKLLTGMAAAGTDDQNLTNATLLGNDLTINIENGNPVTVDLSSLVNDADFVIGNEYNTAFALTGNNLTLTDGGGARVVNLSSLSKSGRNGLRDVGNFIHWGGSLTENTTITQAGFSLDINLDGTGDFTIQDNGVDKFRVQDNGNSVFGGDVEWRDGNIGGTILANLIDDGDDGRFTVRENGNISIDLDANSQFVFNEQGLDRNLRVESDNNPNMLFVDAGNNRVGVGLGTPSEALHVAGGTRTTVGAVIGEHTTYGTHLLTMAKTANPSLQLGTIAFNQAEAGRLIFEERIPDYPTPGLTYCGFQFDHNGANNSLSLRSACSTESLLVTFQRNGDVGFNTGAPTANLSVNGTANKTGGGTWAVFSDRRLKKDITKFTEGLDFIQQVRTVNFSYNDKMTEIWGENPRTKGRVYQGVIAQELQEIAPDMVREVNPESENNPEDADYVATTTKGETFLEVDPNKFTYALINAVQEQQVMIEELKKQQAATQKELQRLQSLLENK